MECFLISIILAMSTETLQDEVIYKSIAIEECDNQRKATILHTDVEVVIQGTGTKYTYTTK